ncbi:uncharacterized protein FIBRA_07633 [Fibroporia radiculosa]|uniref:Arf-GAP domain-containing protein n=1 Tax=Fibroporia radiculosa TaxID=599839 RepID=J4IBX4_9APHY|nr:uncharacterized protein FIBRA_07633 [Fibroporia radiculosa]CCM05416.1 predicted protein [Fibroporia radiculosa]
MNCAGIHRKMGTHISKVKSLTMDMWTKEQVEIMKNIGNIRSNLQYNPNETRHPPPTNMIDSERDSDLEKFIRSKYEFKLFMKATLHAPAPASSSSTSDKLPIPPLRSQTAPVPNPAPTTSSPGPPVPPKTPIPAPATFSGSFNPGQSQMRSASQPVPAPPPTFAPQQLTQNPPQQQLAGGTPTWNSLMSLQSPSLSQAPGVFPAPTPSTSLASSIQPSSASFSHPTNPYSALSASPSSPFPSSLSTGPMSAAPPGSVGRSMSLNSGLAFSSSMGMGGNAGLGVASPSGPASFTTAQTGLGFSAPLSTSTPVSNSNPFTSFAPGSIGSNIGMGSGATPLGQQQPYFLAQSAPFGQTGQQQPIQPRPSPLFHAQSLPQPTQMQMQSPMSTASNPFMQTQQGQAQFGVQMQPQYNATPSAPFGHPQTYPPGNPFAGWQAGQPGGFSGQQWSGM